jgi:lysozyme
VRTNLLTAAALRYAAACVFGTEGYRATAYLDRLPTIPVWTIGHGTTRVNGLPVYGGMTCTLEQANAWAAADMEADALFVLSVVIVPLNDWQLGALISLSYNIGMGNFHHSTVLAALNQGKYPHAADCFLQYDEAGGKAIAGLDTRRARERLLFLCGSKVFPTPSVVSSVVTADDLNQHQLDKMHTGALA